MSEESIEGRLLAHRQILGAIVADLVAAGGGKRVAALLERRQSYQDGEEDPGAVPDPSLAIEAALCDEMSRLAREVELRSGGGPR